MGLRFLLILLIKLLYFTQNVYTNANEVLGCGGFIKSHADIDFSRVEIKLLTKQGALKDKTDCSPSNGYYFLPIYDKGEYLLRISPPPGWSFEPEQVKLNFDGKTDICSQGKDLNFVFKGFGITGKVTIAETSGASGISVELKSKDNPKDIRSTKTDLNGVFSFSPVIPGKYIVRAHHATWHFSKAEHEVVVKSGNTELPNNSLVVAGFDVTGHFDLTEQSVTGIGMALFKTKNNNLPLKCTRGNTVALAVDNPKYEGTSACYAKIEPSGSYTFAGVAPGTYLIQPVVESSKLKLNIEPSHMEFEVTKDVLQIKNIFKISGFDVKGRVLNSQGGTPTANAIIYLNGQKLSKPTDAQGTYVLQNIKSGTYKIQVEVPHYQFNEFTVDLKLTSVSIPDIVPSAYEVCGKVISKKSYTLEFNKQGSTFRASTNTKAETGDWCTYLPSGKYNIEVRVEEADRASGVQFYPVQQQIEVTTMPVSEITFSQLRATLDGEVKCLSDAPAACKNTEVTLHTLDATGQTTGQKQAAVARDGKYVFREILPGPYELTIPQNGLCFDSTRVLINIASSKETAPTFVQRGYEVSIISSHRAIMKYSLDVPVVEGKTTTTTTPTETLKILAGVNTFCVSKYGTYNFKLEGCHLYEDSVAESFTTNMDSSANNAIIITAIAHKVGLRILSTDSNVASLDLAVESQSLGKQTVKPIAESYKVDGKFAYRFDTYLKPGEVLHVTPLSETLLFSPQTKQIVGPEDCVDIAFNFLATRGLTLRGNVVPAIKDVKITLNFPNNADLKAHTVLTNADGEFKFGPFDEKLEYALSAEKESYVFGEYNAQTSTFSAHKLCEIVVKVKTQEADKPLAGVLLSLSGGESYRKNLITGDNGAMSFHSLSPSQYYLRPIMKEYKFEPNSKMIEIKDGETIELDLIAKRVAYSVFGSITSLNGEPFAQVNLEATANEACQHHQEETTSEPNGQYRLRGLHPGCTYTIRSKASVEPSASYVERTVPAQHTVTVDHTDIHNINMIAISPISVLDVTIRVTASLNEYYKTLRLVMYRKDTPDLHIYSQRVETPHNPKGRYNPGIMVFPPRLPLDGKTYIVELRSSLSAKTYAYTQPMAVFVANTSSIFLELNFKPDVRVTEQDVNQNSISALILVALVVIAFFKQDIAMDTLNFVYLRINGVLEDLANRQKNQQNNARRVVEPLNKREIEEMADQINAIKKKKTKKI